MDIKTYDLITDWKERVTDLQKRNYSLSLRYAKLHYGLGGLSVILAAAVVGFFILGTEYTWLRTAVIAGGIISVILIIIQLFFNFSKRAAYYKSTVSQLAEVRRDIELYENYLPVSPTEQDERIRKIEAQIASIEKGSRANNNLTEKRKGWWILQGFIGAVVIFFLVLFSSRLFLNQVPFLTTEQSIEFWMREAVQQGVEDWQFDPADPLIEKRSILVNTWINELTTRKVIVSLAYLNEISNEPIDLLLSSSGGFSKDAYAIVNAIQDSSAPVNTIAIGDCFSACSMLLMSGTGDRKIVQGSRVAIHTHEYPYRDDLYSYYTVSYDREVEFYMKYSNIPLAWINRQENFYYLSPEQAMGYEIVDNVISQGEYLIDE